MIYKERPSQVGKIMANPRSKVKEPKTAGDLLGKTAKSRVQQAYLENNYGIKKTISNKYVEKGIEQEDESINLFAKVSGFFGVEKNEQKYENDHFVGTPDIITNDAVIDIKTSWSAETFPFFDLDFPTKDYEYQVLAYMSLTGKKRGFVAYCLTNASECMIQDEIRRQTWKNKMIDPTDEEMEKIESEARHQMEFDHIPDELRVKIFEVKYDETLLNSIIERVELCGKYYNELDAQIKNQLNK